LVNHSYSFLSSDELCVFFSKQEDIQIFGIVLSGNEATENFMQQPVPCFMNKIRVNLTLSS